MNIVDLCKVKYPNQIEQGNIRFRKPEDDILIAYWNVPNIPKPTEVELIAQIPQYELAFKVFQFNVEGQNILAQMIQDTVSSKGYDSGISCASYANSTNLQWKAEAEAFIAWRDALYAYAISILTDIENGQEPPTKEQFIANAPVITWP